MKIAIFTGNSIRHKFVANSLAKEVDDSLIISECTPSDSSQSQLDPLIQKHFNLRNETELDFFCGHNYFHSNTLPIMYKEVNLPHIHKVVKEFNPDMMFVFGSYIIKEPLLCLTQNKFVNLHLGLSPYYRGSGTNFWPFINNELEFVGSTLLHLDPGIDTGDIIEHVRPKFEFGDTVHTVGCKVIQESVKHLIKLLNMVKDKKILPRVDQWDVENSKYYRSSDFNKQILLQYYKNLDDGLVKNFVTGKKKELKLVTIG
jgi:methionyl-tRNA formyltransferase